MSNIYIVAIIISVLYSVVKYIEFRQSRDENKSLKPIIKDTIIIFVCIIAGNFIYTNLFKSISQNGGDKTTPVFTDNPEF